MARKYIYMPLGKGNHRIELILERKVRAGGYAGFVAAKQFQEEIVIVVNDVVLEELGVRSIYITANKDGSFPRVILSGEIFNGIKRGNNGARFSLLHEIGHYVCGHLENPPALEDEYARRQKLLEQNQVSRDELEADAFAVNYIGAEAVVWALQESMEWRMADDLACGVEKEDISQKALWEYQLRIDAINDRCDFKK